MGVVNNRMNVNRCPSFSILTTRCEADGSQSKIQNICDELEARNLCDPLALLRNNFKRWTGVFFLVSYGICLGIILAAGLNAFGSISQ